MAEAVGLALMAASLVLLPTTGFATRAETDEPIGSGGPRGPSHPGDNQVSNVWVADRGDGTYQNPILHADYSDPDVIRVGDDFYMTASSFNCVPGLPILHSNIGEPFTARAGRWIGAKMGIFAVGPGRLHETGYADFDWFRIE